MSKYKCQIIDRNSKMGIKNSYKEIEAVSPAQAKNKILFWYAGQLGIRKVDGNGRPNPFFRIQYGKFLREYDCQCQEIPEPIKPKKYEQQYFKFENRLSNRLNSI
jgi:hypothetical protein